MPAVVLLDHVANGPILRVRFFCMEGSSEAIRFWGEPVVLLINRGRCTGSHGAVYQLRGLPKKEIIFLEVVGER